MSIPEKYIRQYAKRKQLDFSEHAIIRMGERCIDYNQVINCVENGKVIEHQSHGEDIKILFQEASILQPEFYTIVAASSPYPVVVSVCKFKEEAWEFVNGLMIRRTQKC